MEYRELKLEAREVALDGNTFVRCVFQNCAIVWGCRQPFTLTECELGRNIRWRLEGPALDTIQFLAELYRHGGTTGRELVVRTFERICREDAVSGAAAGARG